MNSNLLHYFELLEIYLPRFMLILGLISAIYKSLPQSYRDYLESTLPRIANLFRVIYSLGPDLVKTIQSSKLILTGKPWRELNTTQSQPTQSQPGLTTTPENLNPPTLPLPTSTELLNR